MINSHDQLLIDNLYAFYRRYVGIRYSPLHHAWFIKDLAKKLQDLVYDPKAKNRLMCAMPPQHSKSSLITLAFPVWLFCKNPKLNILIVSSEQDLASNFGIKIRELIYSCGHRFGIKVSNVKSSNSFIMVEKHGRLCDGSIQLTGSRGHITGRPVDLIIIDDPYKGMEDEFTPTALNKKWNWFTSIIEQRLRKHTKLAILHTRWHSEDIQGRILADEYQREKYEHVEYAAIDENGEPLWPEYYDLSFYEDKERTMGERQFQAIYQQTPLDLTSDYFYLDHLIWDDHYISNNFNIANCRSYDMAYTSEREALAKNTDADYTAGLHAEKINENHYIFSDWLYKRLGEKNIDKVQSIARFDGVNKPILIEPGPKGGAAKELFRLWDKDYLSEYKCIQSEPIGTKADRAYALKNAIFDGKIHIHCTDKAIRKEIKSQLEAFPNGTHDDLVDAMAYAYNYLKDKKDPRGLYTTSKKRHGRRRR